MKTLISVVLIAVLGCGSSRSAVRRSSPIESDELIGACVPERAALEPRHCVREDDGTWKTSSPPSNALLQGKTLLNDGRFKPAVVTLTYALTLEDDCGKQFVRWLRAEANTELGDRRAAFLDYASVIRDGPEHPFYKEVWPRIEALKPFISEQAYYACAASYVPPETEAVEGKDEHWEPYAPGEKP